MSGEDSVGSPAFLREVRERPRGPWGPDGRIEDPRRGLAAASRGPGRSADAQEESERALIMKVKSPSQDSKRLYAVRASMCWMRRIRGPARLRALA